FSYSSVVLNGQAYASVSADQTSVRTDSGAANLSFSGTGSGTSNSSYVDQGGTGTSSYTYAEDDAASYTATGTVHDVSQATDSVAFYAAGIVTFGQYSLSSSVVQDRAGSSDTVTFATNFQSNGSGTASATEYDTANVSNTVGIVGTTRSGNGTVSA